MLMTALIQQSIYAVIAISECDECGFNDLAKLLFGGLALALIVGVAVSILHRRIKDKSSQQNEFVSITTQRKE
jgi:hypothetical protein